MEMDVKPKVKYSVQLYTHMYWMIYASELAEVRTSIFSEIYCMQV